MEPCVFPVFILPVVWNMCENLHFQRARYTTAKNTIDRQCTERAQLLEYYLHSFRRLWVIARAIVALWLLIIYFSSHTRTFVVLKPSDNKVLLFFHTLGLIKKQQQQQRTITTLSTTTTLCYV